MKRFTQEEKAAWREQSRQEGEHWKALLGGVRATMTSEKWAEYLAVQARFHRYSPGNVMLIWLQMPTATQVAGYHAWKRLGRHVKAGEKGLRIYAPCFMPKGEALTENDDGMPKLRGFRLVSVFDISQTDGDPVPSANDHCIELQGDGHAGLYDALVEAAHGMGLTIDRRSLGAANGCYIHSAKRITLDTDLPADQAAKTLAHELAHHVMHRPGDERAVAEGEAESVAYLVCQMAGMDTSQFSFGYIADWLSDVQASGEAATELLAESQARILDAARKIAAAVGTQVEDEEAA